MTKKEKELLQKMEDTKFIRNGKLSYELLNVYFRLLRQIITNNSFHIDLVMGKLEEIKQKCQACEQEYVDWRRSRQKDPDRTCQWVELDIDNFSTLYWNCVLLRSYWSFEDFIVYMERKREPVKRFYEPRKGTLKMVVDDLQEFEFSKTQKFYGLSMPSRVGKSTICLLFLCWVAMRKPNSHSAMGGHSGLLAKGFYKEMINFMTSEEYEFERIFRYHHPEYDGKPMMCDKSAEDLTITLGDSDRFATLVMRGIDGTWTGAVDISGNSHGLKDNSGYLYVDDLVRDREHSLNPHRMENTWQEYLNKMVDRKNDGAKELMVGTLWNVYDPLMRLKNLYENDPDYVFKTIPALDDNDESNFQYKINGFSTQYYREMRERLDTAEWNAKFQQKPQIREGILFERESMKRFLSIPENGYTFAYCDPALGGGDFLSMPICREVEQDRYKIVDWIYDPSSIAITVPRMVDKVIKWNITRLVIEIDGAGSLVHKELEDELKKRDCLWCEVVPKHSSNRLSKEQKIQGRADFIKEKFEFLDDSSPNMTADYKKAFNDTCMFTTLGKNLHDDAPDSLAGLTIDIKPLTENGTVSVPDFNPFRMLGGLF